MIMATRLIIDGNAVYEVDEECMEAQKRNEAQRRTRKKEPRKETAREKKKTEDNRF